MPGKIIYACAINPTLARPAGGSRVIYKHVEMLMKSGYDAAVWNLRNTSHNWFSSAAPIIHGETLELDESDILVIPQEYALFGIADPAPGCRKVCLSQSITLFAPGLTIENYLNWTPPPAMWVVSEMCYEIMVRLRERLRITSVNLIPPAIDAKVFRFPDQRQRKISWMPRKRRFQSELLYELLKNDDRLCDVTLSTIDGMHEHQAASEICTSSVFIALPSISEGFGLPPAEALAAGCVVVGYPAGGGEEIFECPGAFALPDSDFPTLVDKVTSILSEPPADDERRRYRQWVKEKYNKKRQFEKLVEAIEETWEQPARSGVATHPGAMSIPNDGRLLSEIKKETLKVKDFRERFILESG